MKLGGKSYQFEVEEKDEMETLYKMIVLSSPIRKCICGNEDTEKMYFTTNKDKEGNTYVNVKCAKCGARSKLGKLKIGGYFWKEFEQYVPKTQETQSKDEGSNTEQGDEQNGSGEEMPF
jgi:hypothetical protein